MDGSKGAGIGARVPRLEDDRYLRGRGKYIGDIKLSGMKEVAFLRSPVHDLYFLDWVRGQ